MAAVSRAPRVSAPARPVVVRTYAHVVEAELALGHLHSVDIPATLKDVHTLSVAGHLTGAMGGIKLVVPEDLAHRAQQALDDVQVVANEDDTPAELTGGAEDERADASLPVEPRVRHRGAAVAVRAGLVVLLMGRVLVGGTGNGARLEGGAALVAMMLGWRHGRRQQVIRCGACEAHLPDAHTPCPACGRTPGSQLQVGA